MRTTDRPNTVVARRRDGWAGATAVFLFVALAVAGCDRGVEPTLQSPPESRRLSSVAEAVAANSQALGGAATLDAVESMLKHSLIDATFDYVHSHRDEYNPGKIDKAVKEAIKKTVHGWIDCLGCDGKA